MQRVIHHVFAPLADARQCRLALRLLWQPWKWKNGTAVARLEQALSQHFAAHAVTFGSGRESLFALLQTLHPKPGDEVIVQGYTCVVVPNAIQAAGMTPVFADIDPHTLNLDVTEVETHITPRTRAIICQHTFGIPADTTALQALCDHHNITLIEDCAHILPDQSRPPSIGTASMLFCSFGRDKALSGVTGGAAIVRDETCYATLQKMQSRSVHWSVFRIKRLLLYPLLYRIAKPFYTLYLGKLFLAIAGRLRLLIPVVTSAEKRGHMDNRLHRIPNACAALALDQLQRLSNINAHRRRLTSLYLQECKAHAWPVLHGITDDLPLQKFPVFTRNANTLRRTLKSHHIYLDDGWTRCTICPCDTDAYTSDMPEHVCDVAESIFSLPTHPDMSEDDARILIRALERAGGLHSTT